MSQLVDLSRKLLEGFCNYRTKWTAIFFIFGTFDHGTKFFADPLWTLQVQIFRDIPWLNVRLQHLDHLWIIWLRKSSVVPWSRNDPWSWASCVLAEKKSNSKVFTDDSVWIKIYPYPLLIHSKNWEQWLWLHPNPPLCTPSLRSVIHGSFWIYGSSSVNDSTTQIAKTKGNGEMFDSRLFCYLGWSHGEADT